MPQMEWVMMIRPQVASNCKTQQDISLPASFDGKNKLSTDIDAKLNKLHLQTFRNYEIADLDLESDAVVLTGPNGAGKTICWKLFLCWLRKRTAACPS